MTSKQTSLSSTLPDGDTTPAHILIVDDADVVRDTVNTILSSYGYKVTAVASTAAALQRAATQAFNLALLDVNLPDGSGVDLIEPLHELQPHLAVIMLTGEASIETAVGAINRGASAYLTKPWDEEKSIATIREALHRQRLTLENERLVSEIRKELEERRRAEQVAKTQRAIAEALAETAAVVNSSLDINQVLDEILARVGRVVPHDSAHIMLITSGVARVVRSQSVPPRALDKAVLGLRFPVPQTPTLRQMAQTLKPVIVADTRDSGMWVDQPVSAWIRSYVGAPIAIGGEVSGFVSLNSATPGFFGKEHARRLRAFAHQAGVAIRNASLYARTRRLLQKTEAQATQMRQVFDTVSDGLVLLDRQRRLVMANPLGQEYLDCLCGEAHDTLDRLGSLSLDKLLDASSGALRRHEIEVEEPQRRIFQVRVHAMAAGEGGDGWLLVLHEVTEEREHQMYLQRQDQLATVGRLAAGIAHDFNNIMAVITLYSQILMNAELSAKNMERLDVIFDQARNASTLIRQILDFSRQSVLERGPLHLTAFLKELVKLSQRTLPETIDLQFDCGEEDYDIYADPTRIQQALLNLLVNARDAMPEGGSLTISLDRFGADHIPPLPDMPRQEWIRIGVSDTGCGIPAEVVPHIFEPFFTTKPPGEGTGLGLAQVYGIVKQHDGFLDLTTRPGEGTTFHLYFPPLKLPQTGKLPLPAQPAPKAEGELVMIVEDNDHIRAALQETLEALNYRVIAAADGLEALQQLDAHHDEIDVVLSDMVMPRMGGKQLYDELQRRVPALGMVLFSGYPLDDESKALFEGGHVTWLEKPFTHSAVANAIRTVGHTRPFSAFEDAPPPAPNGASKHDD